ncbi:MAG TPA: hypothetical protein VFA68_15280 [Terriglobales bacterium]|nr:hypothetical protein [Terriglobales bacterium]
MSTARKILIFGGVALALFGMLYGLHYAVFVEHQTLDGMGRSLTLAFTCGAARNLPEAQGYIHGYADTKYKYVRQVDVHSHWIGLAMLMIVLGAAFDSAALGASMQKLVALSMLAGSIAFPLGVMLQTVTHGGALANGFAIGGSALVIMSLGLTAFGFARDAL